MAMPIIFGFGHRAKHGKDTVADMIIAERGSQYNIMKISFAEALKKEVNELAEKSGSMFNLFYDGLRQEGFGYLQANGNIIALPDWVQYDPNADMTDPLCPYGKQRTFLQWYGTQYRRSIDAQYWVSKHQEACEKSGADIVFAPDMRFPNEMQYVREYGETTKVHRPNFDNGLNGHISEEALASMHDSEWSAVISNDRTLEDLRKMALYVFDELLEKEQ